MWGSVTAAGRQRGVASAYDKSQRVFWALGGSIMLALTVVGPWEFANFAGPIPRDGLPAWIGLALFATGDVLQAAAMWALHGLYTSRLGVQPHHRVVTNGPYHLVRHPGYVGAILCLLGMGLALSSLIAIGLAILFVPILVWRIGREKEMLLTEFGEEYRSYMKKTKRLIPLVY
jgi:protein-S-isoprenylcysteine O-methyltransferase Ste14